LLRLYPPYHHHLKAGPKGPHRCEPKIASGREPAEVVRAAPASNRSRRAAKAVSLRRPIFKGLLHFEWVKNPAAVRERGTGQGIAEFFAARKRGMISPCPHHDGWLTHTAFPAFAPGASSTASSATPRPASFAFCGGGKNKLWGLWARAEGLLRPQGPQAPRPVVWRYPGVPGGRGAARAVPQLRSGEAGEAVLGGRQSVLHQALCLLCRTPVPHGHYPRRRPGVASGLADGQGIGQAVHAGAAATARAAGTKDHWRG